MLHESSLPLFERAAGHGGQRAVIDDGGVYPYDELLSASSRVAAALLADVPDLEGKRVAFMFPPGFDYVAVLWGIWRAGGIAVPLGLSHPLPEIEHVLDDSGTEIVIAHDRFEEKLQPLGSMRNARLVAASEAFDIGQASLPNIDVNRRGMILYTSGTTSKPKGVVLTHANLTAQITTLIDAWEWTSHDYILNVLPLHHMHGIVNALLCALWAGATCEMLPGFDDDEVWGRFIKNDPTIFMAVPTIYLRLIESWESAAEEKRWEMSQACARMRLMVSGSAALPTTVFDKWKAITGHELLERYGMTEIGMALSNPIHGERRPGFVGVPFPNIDIRLVDESGNEISVEGEPGEIQVRGATVFLEYWGKSKATQETLSDGWFCTGDVAVVTSGYYRILGRKSVDIIKTGGYKVSALEIEEVLREHPAIRECAVAGVEDLEWGERVWAAVVLNPGFALSLNELRQWAKRRLAGYKVPTRMLLLDELPRNEMGKVNKEDLRSLMEHS